MASDCVRCDSFLWVVWTLTSCVWSHREKFIRLQHENKMLRVQQEECEREKIAALQAQLEEAYKSQNELDTENRFHHLSLWDQCGAGCANLCFKPSFLSSRLWSICRLIREQVSELQQQVEDLQKALQNQPTKPDDVSECYPAQKMKLISLGSYGTCV